MGVRRHHRGGGGGHRHDVRRSVSEPGALDAEPGVEPDDLQRVVESLHAEDHDVGRGDRRPAGDRLPGLDVLGVPAAHLGRSDTGADRPVGARVLTGTRRGPLDPRLWRASATTRPFLIATVCCAVAISACAVASAIVLAHLVAGVITDPATRNLDHWTGPLLILL